MERNKAVFLDRDGVVNHDPGDYTRSLDEFHVLPTVYEALKQLQDAGFLLVLITNQGGIAKGLYTHEHVHEIHRFFRNACAVHGIQLTDIYYSPHHPDFGESLSRKPGGLMIEKACARYRIAPEKSWMIGDKARDIEAGHKAGVPGIQIPVNSDLIDVVPQIVAGHV